MKISSYLIRKNKIPNECVKFMLKYGIIYVSPNDSSFYSTNEKTWDITPEGTYRCSNHWNFKSSPKGQRGRKKIHCRTNFTPKTEYWTIARYESGHYSFIAEFPYYESNKYEQVNIFNYQTPFRRYDESLKEYCVRLKCKRNYVEMRTNGKKYLWGDYWCNLFSKLYNRRSLLCGIGVVITPNNEIISLVDNYKSYLENYYEL